MEYEDLFSLKYLKKKKKKKKEFKCRLLQILLGTLRVKVALQREERSEWENM